MHPMPLTLGWRDVLLRLALTIIAGAAIGLNRDQHGRPAGLRTTLLVCLAAAVAMIEANCLLPAPPGPPNSPIRLDLMRLPLGILSGMGFIGGGAILRRSEMVIGVTTAATLWFVTVVGLCFGGGQLGLGIAGTVLGLAVLRLLKIAERFIRRDHRALLLLATQSPGRSESRADAACGMEACGMDTPDEERGGTPAGSPPNRPGSAPLTAELADHLRAARIRIHGQAVTYSDQGRCLEIRLDLRWRDRRAAIEPPSFLAALATRPGVRRLEWQPQGLLSS